MFYFTQFQDEALVTETDNRGRFISYLTRAIACDMVSRLKKKCIEFDPSLDANHK